MFNEHGPDEREKLRLKLKTLTERGLILRNAPGFLAEVGKIRR
jgi:hypothetical protein